MINRVSHVGVYVVDQDTARDFFVNKLGFELRMDQTMENGLRWLTVAAKGQPDLEIILMKIDGPNMTPEAAKRLRELQQGGHLSGGVLQTTDCRTLYDELRAKGVEFVSPPREQFYGIEAIMKDDSGNWYSVVQRKP